MTTATVNTKHYLIVGLGLTGLSCARFCQSRGYKFSLCDTRTELPTIDSIRGEFPGVEIALGLPDVETLSQYDELVVSPGINVNTPVFIAAAERGVTISGDVQLFAEHRTQPVIAITGSNGKSTVTTLVADMLNAAGVKAAACGNIGVPVLDLLTHPANIDVYVAELSSFQLETTRNLGAEVAGILNISPDHMDRYAGMADYERAKQRIFQNAKCAVINGDDDHTLPALSVPQSSTKFSLRSPASNDFGITYEGDELWLAHGSERLIRASELSVRGMHNVANALAALAFINALKADLNIDLKKCLDGLKNFKGLDHRCQHVALLKGIEYINDSKGTNEGSTVAAIQGLEPVTSGDLWLIAGGESKGQTFAELAAACEKQVAGVYLYGADRSIMQSALPATVVNGVFNTLAEALAAASENAAAGDTVLFSPACASFDQFRNYVHRGEFFRSCVEALS